MCFPDKNEFLTDKGPVTKNKTDFAVVLQVLIIYLSEFSMELEFGAGPKPSNLDGLVRG